MTSTQLYQDLMNGRSYLTKKEEMVLGEQIASGDHHTKLKARNTLVERHIPLVINLAHEFSRRGSQSLDDLIQAGTLGLIFAADRWDHLRENRFSTYAREYVKDQFRQHIKLLRPVYIPTIHTDVQTRKNIAELTDKLRRSPSNEEVSAAYDISVRKVRSAVARAAARANISLQQPLKSESTSEFQDLIQGVELTPEKVALVRDELEDARKRLNSLFKSLSSSRARFSARNREIFEYFFGIKAGKLDGEKKKLDEVATRYKISRERVRQVVLAVWRKISNRPLGGYEDPFRDELDRIELLEEILSRAEG